MRASMFGVCNGDTVGAIMIDNDKLVRLAALRLNAANAALEEM